jgi:hypothetical protein
MPTPSRMTPVEELVEKIMYCPTGTLSSIQIATAPLMQNTVAQISETCRKKRRNRWWRTTSSGKPQNSPASFAISGRPSATVPRNTAPMAKLPRLGCRK